VAGYFSVAVSLGRGDGTFDAPTLYWVGMWPESLAIGDLNGDDCLDLATDAHAVAVLLNNGDGTFGSPTYYEMGPNPVNPSYVVFGDLDGDTWLDLAAITREPSQAGAVWVLLNHGDGTFGPAVGFGTGDWPWCLATGDMNNDERLDLVTPAQIAHVVVLMNQGAASLPGDVDGDHDVDLADLAGLLGAYGVCEGDPDYDPNADFDANGCVDLWDLLALLNNYGAGT